MVRVLRWMLGALVLGLVAPACGVGFTTSDTDSADDDGADDDGADDDGADDDGSDDDGADDDDDTTPSGNVSISAITPSSGTLAGGYEATIYGSNFTNGPDTDVYFGTILAQTIGCTSTDCTVVVPGTAAPGPVQVALENSNGVGVLPDGFTYTEDLSGLESYIVEFIRYDILTPDLFDPPFNPAVDALAFFMVPEDHDVLKELVWGNLLPAMGSCTTYDIQIDPQTFTLTPLDAGSSVSLQGPTSITIPKNAPPDDFYYQVIDLPLNQFQVGTYSLQIPGGADLAAETVNASVSTPAPFTVTPNLNEGSVGVGQLAGLAFNMQPANCQDATVRVDVYDSDGFYQISKLCRFPSGSNMVVDLSAYSNALAFVPWVECAQVTETPVASGATMVGIGRALTVGVLMVN